MNKGWRQGGQIQIQGSWYIRMRPETCAAHTGAIQLLLLNVVSRELSPCPDVQKRPLVKEKMLDLV